MIANDDEGITDEEPLVIVENGTFVVGGKSEDDSYDGDDELLKNDESTNLNQRTFTLSGVNKSLKKSSILAVVGPVGAGKSTLLNALIGDVASTDNNVKIDKHLSYASQTPLILNTTVRDNMLFGKPYDEDLFNEVLRACNLLPDLVQLGPSRDLTEIGERGVTLSGGQKARISIARCVYAQPKVALFDDVLSALDASTAKFIFESLFDSSSGKKSLLSESGVILVTHAAHFLSRVDEILVLSKGESKFIGTWDELMMVELNDPDANDVISSIRSSLQESDEGLEEEANDKETSTNEQEVNKTNVDRETIMTGK